MLHPSGLPENLRNLDRTLVMGVLNVTPDSFSDGGRFDDTEIAISHALQMIEDGAESSTSEANQHDQVRNEYQFKSN